LPDSPPSTAAKSKKSRLAGWRELRLASVKEEGDRYESPH
jgi:hypothetical protein